MQGQAASRYRGAVIAAPKIAEFFARSGALSLEARSTNFRDLVRTKD
jgi:hypothetical protein